MRVGETVQVQFFLGGLTSMNLSGREPCANRLAFNTALQVGTRVANCLVDFAFLKLSATCVLASIYTGERGKK